MEQLIFVAILLLVGLINMIVRYLRQGPEASTPGEARPKPAATRRAGPAGADEVVPTARPAAPVRSGREPQQPRRRPPRNRCDDDPGPVSGPRGRAAFPLTVREHMERRAFLRNSLTVAAALGAAGVPGLSALAHAQGAPDDREAAVDALVESLAHAPMSLQALDILGTANFADAMGGIAVQGDSLIQKLLLKVGLSTPAEEHPHGDHHEHAFPLANLTLAAALNIVRASAFGAEVRRQTIHESETTLVGVAMLMGLTSVAKGIISSEGTAMQMVDRDDVSIRRDPEETIADSIFQLTLLAAATQIPLTSFGNAAIGNEEFREVRLAFSELYRRFLPVPSAEGEASRAEVVAHIRGKLAECKNPVILRQVTKLLDDTGLERRRDFVAALEGAATWHTHDLMTILMSTSCDDSQAALGDPGPLVGLYQTYGVEFLQALPSLVPYTILIGFERAMWAMNRAGVQQPIFTKAKWIYMRKFLKETWRNLIVYFATVAPEISSRITGTRRITGSKAPDEGVGVTFSVLEQILKDVEAIITAFMDPFLNDRLLDTKKTRKAVADLQDATRQWYEAMGRRVASRLFPPREGSEHEARVARAEVLDDQAVIVGQKESGGAPYTYKKDELPQTLKDIQIRLAAIVDEAGIEKFAAELREIRRTVGPQLEREIEEELRRQGRKPTVVTALEVVRRNPRARYLVDVNYWHERIGPALTDTMFVVLLQGLHLPFLLSTSERLMYDAAWFKGMPLTAREVVSVLYNNALGLFADNWADCVAHARWLTNMYLSELAELYGELFGDFAEVETALRSGYFKDDSTRIIPERFRTNAEQAATLVGVLQRRYPGAAERLEAALRRYLGTAEDYYFKSMIMAMTISVVGAGKSLPGDSTHFTFAAGEKDFTLAVTLLDFKRHPLYHVWELIFSGAYAMFVGPFLAQTFVAPLFGNLAMGTGAVETIKGLMQAEFRKQYPGMAERFEQLEAHLPKKAQPPAPSR
jgi:hypothetical protein